MPGKVGTATCKVAQTSNVRGTRVSFWITIESQRFNGWENERGPFQGKAFSLRPPSAAWPVIDHGPGEPLLMRINHPEYRLEQLRANFLGTRLLLLSCSFLCVSCGRHLPNLKNVFACTLSLLWFPPTIPIFSYLGIS